MEYEQFVLSAKIMNSISYAFNITLLIVIIGKNYLSGFMSIYVCFKYAPKSQIMLFIRGFIN